MIIFNASWQPLRRSNVKRSDGNIHQIAVCPVQHQNHPVIAEPLTAREMDVLMLLREPLSNKEIASQLYLSPSTVKRHTINLYGKLGVHSRREAVAAAIDLGNPFSQLTPLLSNFDPRILHLITPRLHPRGGSA